MKIFRIVLLTLFAMALLVVSFVAGVFSGVFCSPWQNDYAEALDTEFVPPSDPDGFDTWKAGEEPPSSMRAFPPPY